jgi:amino acid permease
MVGFTQGKEGEEAKSSSIVIIFSCWNTMVGSAMVSLPWAFMQSGIALGIIISFTSFLISFYTCALIIKTAKNDEDYVFTLKKYYGKPGFYIGLIGPTILIFGAITVYFVVIVQSLYPILYLILVKAFKMNLDFIDPNVAPYFHLESFSASYVSLGIFCILVPVCLKKDLSIFMRMGSIGAFCVTSLIIFVISYSIYSISNTTYAFKLTSGDIDPKILDVQNLMLFNKGYGSLASVLCAGYFIH